MLNPMKVAALLVVAAGLAFPIDLQVVEFVSIYSWPRELWKIVKLAEVFGHAFAVVVAAVLIWRLDDGWRRKVPSLVVSVTAAGLAANLVKLVVTRTRPNSLDFVNCVTETFGGMLPLISAGSSGQSFPSGHVALAAALACSLSRFYPRACLLFALLACLVMLQRIVTDSHFVSDVMAGAALGVFVVEIVAVRFERYTKGDQPPSDPPQRSAPLHPLHDGSTA